MFGGYNDAKTPNIYYKNWNKWLKYKYGRNNKIIYETNCNISQ